MDFSGSVQTSVFAYLLMAVVAMLTAVMVHGIVVVLQRAQQRSKAEIAPTAVSISVAAAVDGLRSSFVPLEVTADLFPYDPLE